MVEEYNKYMGGVDRNDQMVPYYSYSHKLVTLLQLHVKILISGQKNGGDYFFISSMCQSSMHGYLYNHEEQEGSLLDFQIL